MGVHSLHQECESLSTGASRFIISKIIGILNNIVNIFFAELDYTSHPCGQVTFLLIGGFKFPLIL